MINLGLLGYPLSHSLSPILHRAALREAGLDGNYSLFSISPDCIDEVQALLNKVKNGELLGLNVTIPYKQSVLRLLDELKPASAVIGAVNTIYSKQGKLIGDNTDAPGFLADLHRHMPDGFEQKSALILGSGGAARALVFALIGDGWKITLAVRQADSAQAQTLITDMLSWKKNAQLSWVPLSAEALKDLSDLQLVVNATPVGMYPEINGSSWPKELLMPQVKLVYDLVYNPRETEFLGRAKLEGLQIASGIGMLIEQAALSFEAWTGFRPSRNLLRTEVENL
jgi:shikimate dehydrogenase